VADSELVPSAEAADRLGVSQQEVRRLVGSGALRGTRIAHRVMVDRVSLELRLRRQVTSGARRTPANAWAMLRMVTSDDVDFLDRVTRSKLRASLKQITAERLLEVTGRRARVHHYKVRDHYLPRILGEVGVVRTGLSAVEHDPAFDLVSLDTAAADVYCDEQTHRRIRDEYALVAGDELSKVTLRVVDDVQRALPGPDGYQIRHALAVCAPDRAVAVTAAICVDLMEHLDTRVVRAGRRRLEDLLREFRAQAGWR
jgi:hypothetical protein